MSDTRVCPGCHLSATALADDGVDWGDEFRQCSACDPAGGTEDVEVAHAREFATLAADNARLRDLLREWFDCDTVAKSADWQTRARAALETK